jgi:hypothetical protein
MNKIQSLTLLFFGASLCASIAQSQTPARDPSVRLREVLPAPVAQRILDRIADVRARELPAEALENRALKFAAKGVAPDDIERSVAEQADRMETARTALIAGRGSKPRPEEIEAAAEALRKGVADAALSRLAKFALDRSLAIPLYVIGTLTDLGLSSSAALERVLARLEVRATDADLEALPATADLAGSQGEARSQGASSNGRKVGQVRRATSGRPATAGPPAGVPGNGGGRSKKPQSHKPPKK